MRAPSAWTTAGVVGQAGSGLFEGALVTMFVACAAGLLVSMPRLELHTTDALGCEVTVLVAAAINLWAAHALRRRDDLGRRAGFLAAAGIDLALAAAIPFLVP